MNISPDDFEKFGIDDSVLDEKGKQTTYKIKYVTRRRFPKRNGTGRSTDERSY